MWRRARAGKYLRHLPRLKRIRGSWLHRKIGDRLVDSALWQPGRDTVARGLAIGAFFSMLPIPFQMLPAAVVAIALRANVPVALVGCWISNPITMPLFLVVQIQVGFYLLGWGSGWKLLIEDGMWDLLFKVPGPLILGSLVVGAILAVIGYFCGIGLYDWAQLRIEKSAAKHRARRVARGKPVTKPRQPADPANPS